MQDENDPSTFVDYKKKDNTSFWQHVDPDRMRAPVYQNATQVIFSIIYLALYSGAINTVNRTGRSGCCGDHPLYFHVWIYMR